MNTITESSLDFITVAREPIDLGAGDHGKPRPMLIQCKPSRRRRFGNAIWWTWPTSWAVALTFGYFVSESLAATVNSLIVNAAF
ncbi:MAG: hypothetical protein QGI63_03645 [Rhodospirillales bacterium]|jgi:hypothetical protein|nr:hypothetical protein [Rhodospirillales bacterium]MDP6773343.1 hypothetical protein [Rhodospirillales bacterium]